MLLPDYITRFVKIDRENDCIHLPEFGHVITKFSKWYTCNDVTTNACIWGKKKLRPKLFFEKYGTTAKVVARWINGAQHELWIHGELTTKLAMRRTGLSAPWVRNVHEALPHLQQAQRDGLDNLLPIIAFFKKSPHDLKKMFGKSAWVKLAHNSFTRNKKLALTAGRGDFTNTASLIDQINVPSTLLGLGTSHVIQVAMNNNATLKAAAAWLSSSETTTHRQIVMDTMRMAQQLTLPTNLKWTIERWYHEHERMTKIVNERRYSSKPFTSSHEWVDEENKLKAVRLISARQIADEGAAMYHCVASYISAARKGVYHVYSIRDMDDIRVGTLGIRSSKYDYYFANEENPHVTSYVLDQLVGPCNQKFELPLCVEKLISDI